MTSARTQERIEAITGQPVLRLHALSGGCVGDVYRVELNAGPGVVAKVGEAGSGLALEGRMLAYLREHSDLPVPDVLSAEDELLLMSLLDGSGGLNASAQTDAGEKVAALHNISSERGFGFDVDTVIGGLHQPNPWTTSWVEFFRDQRLMAMGREAHRAGRLPASTLKRLDQFCADVGRWITEPEKPSLIHGDMWGGNVLAAGGRITGFIDPAIYYADAEIELAFTTMFNTFGDLFFKSYQRQRTIRPGFFEERLDIYNLYPLLVHVRLFGGSYVASVEGTLKRFGY